MTDDRTVLYLEDDDMDDLVVVLDAADLMAEEQRRVGDVDDELEEAVQNISTIAGVDMGVVREIRISEERKR